MNVSVNITFHSWVGSCDQLPAEQPSDQLTQSLGKISLFSDNGGKAQCCGDKQFRESAPDQKKKKEKIIVGMRNDEMPFIETLATWNKQKKNDESLNVLFSQLGPPARENVARISWQHVSLLVTDQSSEEIKEKYTHRPHGRAPNDYFCIFLSKRWALLSETLPAKFPMYLPFGLPPEKRKKRPQADPEAPPWRLSLASFIGVRMRTAGEKSA